MFSGDDLIASFCALVAHAVIALVLVYLPPPPAHSMSTTLEVDVRKREPPPPPPVETKAEPPKPEPPKPEPRKVIAKIKPMAPPPVAAPPPNQEVKDPPKDPPKPVFGLTMESTTSGESSVSAPVGNTTMIDPSKSAKHSGPVTPLPAQTAPTPPKPSYQPVSDLYVKTAPEIDGDGCGRSVQYPDEAMQLGIEGTVKLRIELDERGRVHDVRVLSGLGHGLDQAAVNAIRHSPSCKASPAIGTDGKPVPYVISVYSFNFELPR